jgi:CBS domain-containing protein
MKVEELMNKVVVTVNISTQMKDLIDILSREKSGRIVVMDNEKPISVITTRSIIAALSEYGEAIFNLKASDLMSEDLISVSPDDEISYVIRRMIANNIGGVPVIDKNVILGMFTEREAVNLASKIQIPGFVESIMSKKIVTADKCVDLLSASTIMFRNNLRRLPITEGGKLVGIVTAADIVKYVSRKGTSGKVLDAGTKNPITISKYTSISQASNIMKDKNIGTLPVVNGGLEGIVTERDILFSLITQL